MTKKPGKKRILKHIGNVAMTTVSFNLLTSSASAVDLVKQLIKLSQQKEVVKL